MLFLIIYLLLIISRPYNLLIPKQKTNVHIHLEKFHKNCNLLHIGITLNNNNKIIRYDFRSSINDEIYITNSNTIKNTYNNNIVELLNFVPNKKTIFWGISNKTLDEFIMYENNLQKKYILGFYDCRHYVNKFTDWGLNKPTPIWDLYKLWDEY